MLIPCLFHNTRDISGWWIRGEDQQGGDSPQMGECENQRQSRTTVGRQHLIPRYKGDVENPKGGVRGVIPNKQKY